MEPITLGAKLSIEGLVCEQCGATATQYVRDVAVLAHDGQTVLVEHSLHRLCERHGRLPIIYHPAGKIECKAVSQGSPFLSREDRHA